MDIMADDKKEHKKFDMKDFKDEVFSPWGILHFVGGVILGAAITYAIIKGSKK